MNDRLFKNSYQEGNVRKLLFFRTLPMIIGIFSMMAFNLVDMFFVAKLGIKELAAISYTFPVILVISSFTLGLGAGASAVVSRAIGEKDINKVKRLTTDSLLLGLIFTLIFVLCGFIFFDKIFKALGANGEILELCRDYMYVWFFGMIFVVIPMVGNNIVRATGNTKIPGLMMFISILMNIILDPLLIFGVGIFPRMEMAGAALATLISRAITFIIVLYLLIKKFNLITFEKVTYENMFKSWKKILYIGLPNAFTNISVPLGIGIYTKMLSAFGNEAVAAFGITSKIKSFALIVIYALATVLGPFIGQNFGGKNLKRAYEGVQSGHIFAMLWGFFAAVILALFSVPIIEIFTKEKSVIKVASLYLTIVPVAYGCNSLLILSNMAFTVLNKPYSAMFYNVLYMFILSVPLAYAGGLLYDLEGLFTGAAIAQIISGFAAYYALKKYFFKEINSIKLAEINVAELNSYI